ncbi:hypothetical protein SCLCIDRAFT_1209890 [Scleroderma citrinum Foug A]|uniref:Complex 1 LYR protein domain-containing protein n=1 Tax=Scleroderma citrinum Foug A TaxID=1036808 RepID=A0A0C3EIL8_9AGAM|nr:hypothetical protein SCLCIDRAFT_1209890 [Scleroderma citrinum Foug A]
MSTPPTRRALLGLYASTLRAARTFRSYNFRNYFMQRTRDNFRTMLVESDPTKVSHAYEQAVSELMVLRRSAVVNQIYGGLPLCIEEESHMPQRTQVADTHI